MTLSGFGEIESILCSTRNAAKSISRYYIRWYLTDHVCVKFLLSPFEPIFGQDIKRLAGFSNCSTEGDHHSDVIKPHSLAHPLDSLAFRIASRTFFPVQSAYGRVGHPLPNHLPLK